MKKKVLILAALVMAAMSAFAGPIDLAGAQASAEQFLHNKHVQGRLMAGPAEPVRLVHQQMNSANLTRSVYYVFCTGNAFVIVAGDDRAEEILAYGEGALDMNTIPANMKFWLEGYQRQIEFLQAHPGLVVEKPSLRAHRGVSVEPLLEAKWDQGYPYYSQCPMDGDRRGLTGCAATSLAQVFYKWQYPTQPTPVVPGYTTRTRRFELAALPSVTFDWANMLPEYKTGYYNDDNKNAVAQLMRYIGQAEQMDYTSDGSEAWEDDIIRACQMFGYMNATIQYKAVMDFDNNEENVLVTDDDWSTMLQDELVAGRPVVYCAYCYSNAYNAFYGHAFNVDGYDASTGLYSVNWGWSGSGNNYFALRAFTSGSYTYNIGELMIAGIEPPAPIEAYDPVMLSADENYITLTSFRAQWSDETPAENVTSYTLEVTADDGSEPGVYEKVFSESFPYATSNSSSTIRKIDNYCTNAGWACTNAYEARGGIRLGGNGSIGTLTTPALNMTQSGGKMTIVATMLPYSTDTDVPVTISCGNSVASVTVSAEGQQTVILDCEADENQKVTFATTVSNKRVVITQVDIYSATPAAAKMVLSLPAEEGDSTARIIMGITDKFYTVTGLTQGGTFNYRVKACYVNGTQSAWSNIETVTLVDNGPAYDMGDVNHDGDVDINDVTLLIDYLLGNNVEILIEQANMDGNTDIDINDVTMLIDYLLQ